MSYAYADEVIDVVLINESYNSHKDNIYVDSPGFWWQAPNNTKIKKIVYGIDINLTQGGALACPSADIRIYKPNRTYGWRWVQTMIDQNGVRHVYKDDYYNTPSW
jgi:hypothetical protein